MAETVPYLRSIRVRYYGSACEMSNSEKMSRRGTRNCRIHATSESAPLDGEPESEVEFLTPEQWVRFGEGVRLSERELEILVLTSRDFPRKAIARQLGIAFHSVNKLCDRLHKKTGVQDRVALMRLLVGFARKANPI